MKFLHLSDLHIGLRLMNHDLREDQEYILHQIVLLAEEEQPDAILIAGDLYDKAIPSAEAVEIFDGFMDELTAKLPKTAVMIISGNHDSAPRLDCFRSVLSKQNIHMIGMPPRFPEERIARVTLQDEYGPVHFFLLPFVKPSMVKQIVGTDESGNNLSYQKTIAGLFSRERVDPTERNVLVSHQFYVPKGHTADEMERMDSEIRTVGNIDEVSAEILQIFTYAALGHIHKPMSAASNARYCGTPLACSVSEAGQQKGILCVELGDVNMPVKIRSLPLHPLRQVKVIKGILEEILQQGTDDYVTVILTDITNPGASNILPQLRKTFPNLLEVRRENVRKADYKKAVSEVNSPDLFTLCKTFLEYLDDEEESILKDVINKVKEEDEE